LEYSLKKCIDCDWKGIEARIMKCLDCDEYYNVCPKCGRPVVDLCDRPFLYSMINIR